MSNRTNKRKLPDDEKQTITKALKAIKQKNVEEMRTLSKTALEALLKMEKIENDMNEEARAIHPDYTRVIYDFKLTFKNAYQELVEDQDGNDPSIETIRYEVQQMNEDAEATSTTEEDKAIESL